MYIIHVHVFSSLYSADLVRLVSGAGQLYPLNPNQSILYTWDCPDGKREINWQIDRAKDSSWKTIKFDKVRNIQCTLYSTCTCSHIYCCTVEPPI